MKLSPWSAAGSGAVIGLLVFLEGLLFGGVGAEPIRTLLVLLVLGALVGVEWNELHFLERFGTGGFFARWALAGMSVGATVFGVRRAGAGWPWWGLFGAVALGGVLGMAVGLEWGRLLGDPPWQKDRQLGGRSDPGLLRIDWPPERGGASTVASPQERRRADSEADGANSVALATGRIHVRQDDPEPEWREYTVRYARVYVRRDGRWRLLTHHTTGRTLGPLHP